MVKEKAKNRAKIRLVATDLDGTLLDDEKRVPEGFAEWVLQHPDLCVVIASGRQYFNMTALFPEIEERLCYISENGGLVFREGKALYVDEIEKQEIEACIVSLQFKKKLPVILCGEKSAYMEHASQEAERNARMYYKKLQFTDHLLECAGHDRIVKLAVFFEHHDAEAYYDRLSSMQKELVPSLSGECWIDFANPTANKGGALKMIQEMYRITPAESMAFGDYLNDYGLLLNCEESYAMENAHPKLKEIAKHTTLSNQNGGVTHILYSF